MPRRALLAVTVAIVAGGVAVVGGYVPFDDDPAALSTTVPESTAVTPTTQPGEASTASSPMTTARSASLAPTPIPARRATLTERRAATGDSGDDSGGVASQGDATVEPPRTTSEPSATASEEEPDSSGSQGSSADGPETARPSPDREPTTDPPGEPTTDPPGEPTTGATTAPETTERATAAPTDDSDASAPDAPTPIDSCTVIADPGTYALTTDVTDASTPVCIEIDSSDVVFDGRGHVVDGTDANETVGLLVRTGSADRTDVTVRNVTLRDWDDGLRASALEPGRFFTVHGEDVRDGHIERVTSTSNLGAGVRLVGAERLAVTESTIRNNGLTGVSIRDFGDDVVVANSTIADNGGTGLRAYEGGGDLAIRNNAVSGNARDGVRVQNDVDSATIADNDVRGNGRAGVAVSTSWNATVSGNQIESNGGPGILAADSRFDRILDNVVTGNDVGVRRTFADDGLVRGNAVTDNAAEGVLLDGADDNRIERNEVRRNGVGVVLRDADDNTLTDNVVCDNGGGAQIVANDESTGTATSDNAVDCG